MFTVDSLSLLICAVALALGALLGWFFAKSRSGRVLAELRSELEPEIARLSAKVEAKEEQLADSAERLVEKEQEVESLEDTLSIERERRTVLVSEVTQLETLLKEERRGAEEKLELLKNMRENVQESFKALSSEALRSNNQTFLELAQENLMKFQEGAKGDLEKREQAIAELVKPLRESLERVDGKIENLEKLRLTGNATLTEQIKILADQHSSLRTETTNLARALRSPNVRGRWGEIQLRRVVEMAGMVEYCDFIEQDSIDTEAGRIRPDLIVRLPNNRMIVVDAKVPLQAYLEAMETTDEVRRVAMLQEHAKQVRSHIQMLATKTYWEQYQPGPDFVIMFIPGEQIYNAALEADGSLIEFGVDRKVLITTPTNLIGLLRVVAFGWRQEALEKNAQQISELGAELYDRVRTFAEHFSRIRGGLERAVDAYNSSVGSLERRVLVSARRFQDFGAARGEEIPILETITTVARPLSLDAVVEE